MKKKTQKRYDLHKVPLELPQLQQEWFISYCLANGDRRPLTLASSVLNQAVPLEMSL